MSLDKKIADVSAKLKAIDEELYRLRAIQREKFPDIRQSLESKEGQSIAEEVGKINRLQTKLFQKFLKYRRMKAGVVEEKKIEGKPAKVQALEQVINVVADQEGRKLQKAGVKKKAIAKFREKFVTDARLLHLAELRKKARARKTRMKLKKAGKEMKRGDKQKALEIVYEAKSDNMPPPIRNIERKRGVPVPVDPFDEKIERKRAKKMQKARAEELDEFEKEVDAYRIQRKKAKELKEFEGDVAKMRAKRVAPHFKCTKNQKATLANGWLNFVREYREKNNCPTYAVALREASIPWRKLKASLQKSKR